MSRAAEGTGARRAPLAWVILAALALYTAWIFYGVGVPAKGIAMHWYEPRGFLHDQLWSAPLLGSPGAAVAWVGAPALALALACFAAGRSAVARTLAASCVSACLLFAFYGVGAPGVWQFFGWRGSAVLWLLALCLGCALCAPFLAASWLRLSWPLRIASYLPPALVAIAFVRNATGTDPTLPFSISPWPVVPVFGIETGALLALAWQLGAALGLGALALARRPVGGAAPLLAGLGLALALAAPAALLFGAGALELLPFRVDARTLAPTLLAGALTIAGVAWLGRGERRLRNGARWLAVGAALIAAPLFASQALARWDYFQTRERDARQAIDALQRYFAREQLYPDTLQELVEAGDLERLPTPSIGFSLLSDARFRYESFGTSFLLEFQAPRWVECAYTPPFEEEEEAGADAAAAAELALPGLGEAWSCPSAPPELW